MPLIDTLNVAKDHPVPALPQVLGHGYVRLLRLLALPHVGEVLDHLLQVRHVHLLALQYFLQSEMEDGVDEDCSCLFLFIFTYTIFVQ